MRQQNSGTLQRTNREGQILQFTRAGIRWWQKPLVDTDGQYLPAELAVLREVREPGEEGWWLNSRGTKTGVVDLRSTDDGFATRRRELPPAVSSLLAEFYEDPRVTKGVFDLVLWHPTSERIRFVEVKCPHWDRPSKAQLLFARLAEARGVETEAVEWEFAGHAL